MATISTHTGASFSRRHNIRDRSLTDNESHIDKNGVYEIWKDEKLPEAYERVFGEAVEEYNQKQKRADRKIDNYLDKVIADKNLNPAYEMIVGVYGEGIDDEQGKQIMREFVDGWKERNPNLELIGAYYHADEEGQPHVHLDYIPVAEGYSRGVSVRPGLDKALRQQGFDVETTMRTNSKGRSIVANTPQIAWEKRENDALEEICKQHDLTVEHPQAGTDVEHERKEAWQAKKDREREEKELEKVRENNRIEKDWARAYQEETEASYEIRNRAFDEADKAVEKQKEEQQKLEELKHHVQTQGNELSRIMQEQIDAQERTKEEKAKEEKARAERVKEEQTRDYIKSEYQKQYDKVQELDKEIEKANKTLGDWKAKTKDVLEANELIEIKESVKEHRKTVEIPKENFEKLMDSAEAQHFVEGYVREAESQAAMWERKYEEEHSINIRSHQQGLQDMEKIRALEKENKSLKEELSLVKESFTKFLQENKLIQAFRNFLDRFKHEKEQEKELAQDKDLDEPDYDAPKR